MKRKAISKKLRFDVFKRDGFICQYCGSVPPKVILHVDHIHPVSKGGNNEIDNLVTSCSVCNLGKGARTLENIPESLSSKASRIKEAEAQIKGYNKIVREKMDREESDAWDVADIYLECFKDISKADFSSIKKFLKRLPLDQVIESMESATIRTRLSKSGCFRYFCGICWRLIKEDE